MLPCVFLAQQAKIMERVPYHSVSIIQLVADPDEHNGKRVQFIGYARVAFEDNYIYALKMINMASLTTGFTFPSKRAHKSDNLAATT